MDSGQADGQVIGYRIRGCRKLSGKVRLPDTYRTDHRRLANRVGTTDVAGNETHLVIAVLGIDVYWILLGGGSPVAKAPAPLGRIIHGSIREEQQRAQKGNRKGSLGPGTANGNRKTYRIGATNTGRGQAYLIGAGSTVGMVGILLGGGVAVAEIPGPTAGGTASLIGKVNL